MYKKGLIRKISIISKFMTIGIHILFNISRIKGNGTMKFGQLIEYNMKNHFLKKPYSKCGGETITT